MPALSRTQLRRVWLRSFRRAMVTMYAFMQKKPRVKISFTPLSGRPAAIWAVCCFFIAALLTSTLWGLFVSMVPFLLFFAAVATTAARSGAWWGMGSAGAAVLAITLTGIFPGDQVPIRCLAFLANCVFIIWLGSKLRKGAAENQAYQEGIADAVPDFVWSCDPNGRVLYVNTRALEFFGVYLDEFERDGWQHFMHPDDVVTPGSYFPTGDRLAMPYDFECRYRGRDGNYRWFASRAVPIANSNGETVKWVGTSTNIDKRKRAEFEREDLLNRERRARSDAERASRMKDEFLATISHELRTPLNAIVGWVYLLKSGATGPGEMEEGLTAIERSTRVQAQLIEDLLDMSRIISGQIRLDVQPVDLPLVIDSAVETVMPSIEAKQIRLKTIIDPLAGHMRGDPARLQQVIWNLLSNAVKFTPKGGRIDIAVAKVHSNIEITISDSGEGIAADFLPFLFERFRQADGSTTRRHTGLGLGLAIVKQLVELHGGTVEAKSAGEGQGSTFYVRLPLPAATAQEITSPLRSYPFAGSGSATSRDDSKRLEFVKLLIVDDEPDSREVVRRILQGCGAEVTAVESAEQALARLREGRYHVLVSDIGMPEVDGFELIRRVRNSGHKAGSDIPAVALTAFARSEDRRFAMESGFDMFISKPVDPAELVAVVERCAARANREMLAMR